VSSATAGFAAQFAAVNDELIALVEGCDDEQWQASSVGEGWTLAAVAHHAAEVNGAFAGILARLAAGETYTPNISTEWINENNARHAREYATAGKQEVLDLLRQNGDAIASQLETLDEAQLERVAGNFGGHELTVAQVIEYVFIGHTAEHKESVRATLAG
jgi:uncharacterized damage-inducible protein DinB